MTSAVRQRRWRCSRSPPSSSSWPRWSPPQASQSSRSDVSASSACSLPIGATQKHVRLVLLCNGALVGTIAALIGTIAGLALWVVFAPTLESAVDHRIDRLSLPWGLIAMAVLLAIIGATAAAWWPGRAVARVPVVLALSARPPRPRPARHSAIAAAVLIAVGIGCLALSNRDEPPLIVAGLVSTILGTLLLGPLAIRIFSGVAGHVPIAPRLALRDLARYQARSGAALAAITLALGIAAAVVVTAAAEETKEARRMAAELPNLSDRQIRVYASSTRGTELIALPIQSTAEPPAALRASANSRRVSASRRWSRSGRSSSPASHRSSPSRVSGRSSPSGLARQEDPKNFTRGSASTSRRLPSCGTSGSTRPRSIRARTSWPTRLSPPTSSSFSTRDEEAAPSHERPENRQPTGSRLGRGRHRPRAGLVRHASMVFAATAGSKFRRAGSSSQPRLSRASRSPRPRARRPGRPRDRDAAQAHLTRDADGDRNRRGCPARPGNPGDDGRVDPQRERRRPPHPDRDRGDRTHPPHADGGHSRRARAPRRTSRRRGRVRGP